ncbi:metallophosphoesterase family protein [Roseiconus lacunae]|uniref:Metallophosphoesterase n=1 Tax=Roseiconus lacunae TaxID=2605694 RepID=A0ABT7PMR1_9BACT|nr:metallophosphoesterase [Roseiconus lacunae]MDM4017784.1 metallophosphoesterase [Roseiconus lacunae]
MPTLARPVESRGGLVRLAWSSDIHLNHATLRAWDQWVAGHPVGDLRGLLVTGDLSEAEDVFFQLGRIAETFPLPIYFVLGNHDFYGSSIGAVRRVVTSMSRNQPRLVYLTDSAPIELSAGHFLVGEDGWGDGTVGDYVGSPVRLNDFALIEDFAAQQPGEWLDRLMQLGRESAERLGSKLGGLPGNASVVHVATHVPPFRESCWYNGQTTDDNWAPFFVCGQLGEVLLDYARAHPAVELQVYCGHTHSPGVAKMLGNLTVHTAGAVYGEPKVERLLELGSA